MLGRRVGVDLGTTTTRVWARGEGAVMTEPSMVAVDREGRVLGVGVDAFRRLDRDGATLRSALQAGEVSDPVAVDALLQSAVTRGAGRQRIFKPDVMISVAPVLDGGARRLLMDCCARAGARTTYLVDAPLAAALGAAIPVATATAHMVADLGGGTCDVAVLSSETTVSGRCLRRGGIDLTAAVARHLSERHGVTVPRTSAEEAKREVGSAVALAEERTLRLPLPDGDEIVVSSTEVREAMLPLLDELVATVREALDDATRRAAAEVRSQTGLTLTGAAAQLRGIDRLLSAGTGLAVRVAADPAGCVVRGTHAALESLDVVRRNLLYVR